MNQYQVEAFASPHDGRARRYYVMAPTANDAFDKFSTTYPDCVVRNLWVLVPISAYVDQLITTDQEYEMDE